MALNARIVIVRKSTIVCFYITKDVKTVKELFRQRGIHHSVNHDYLQGYLDEFCYRINRSIHKKTIFDNMIGRMSKADLIFKNQIKLAYST